jgi:hypothetical protein
VAGKKITEGDNIVDSERFCPIGVGPLVPLNEFSQNGGRRAFLPPNKTLGIFLPATGECGFVLTEEVIASGAHRARRRCQLCDRTCFEKKPKTKTIARNTLRP